MPACRSTEATTTDFPSLLWSAAVNVPVAAAGAAAEDDAADDELGPYPEAAEVDAAAVELEGAAAGVLLPQALTPTTPAARATAVTAVRTVFTGFLLE
ncbi:hypothetical protein RHODO2019_01380 [Rhodococcus antarcticus]|uniref:Secreted protein n=1 Tax=Rhodococcus antarcticus TaxID=2987751 RepID=A0ABY6P0Y2_9NOCA|nr:hypothetical protein [Rhodococcus antarcticus]UZJ25188.1 hypothetical protein RHODO2019_01380 [Rhodococcus antarcticus]